MRASSVITRAASPDPLPEMPGIVAKHDCRACRPLSCHVAVKSPETGLDHDEPPVDGQCDTAGRVPLASLEEYHALTSRLVDVSHRVAHFRTT